MAAARRDDNDDDDALFVKDGVPLKFCFHRSVTQGRGQISRDVERNGGRIVADERAANVLLVDEQEDLALMRRRYYSSTERYRLSLYIEPRGFVKACIRSGTYVHIAPVRQGMPGRRAVVHRVRVPFTEEDRDHLAYYLATRCPARDGRMGNSAYKDLEALGRTDDPAWAWARRHTFHSWREHYKMNPERMDPRIEYYLERLKGVGHHFGHDPRSHDHRNVRRQLAEEEESGEDDEDDDEEQWRGIGRRGEVPGPPVEAARDYLARHGQGLIPLEEEDNDDGMQQEEEEEVDSQDPRRAKRHRLHPDAHRQRDVQEAQQAKKVRVSAASSNERQVSGTKGHRGESHAAHEEDTSTGESEEIEGSDLFGDRTYDMDDQGADLAMPFSPRGSPAPDQDGPPPSTQATLIASPDNPRKEPSSVPAPSPAESMEGPPTPTMSSGLEQTLDASEERIVTRRVPVRGVSAQPGPSMPREKRTGGDATLVDPPHRNTRARSRSVEPQSQSLRQRGEEGGSERKKMKEALAEEDVNESEGSGESCHISLVSGLSSQDEVSVEGQLLEASIEDGDEDDEDMLELPPFQEIEVEADSDDAGSLEPPPSQEIDAGSGLSGSDDEVVRELPPFQEAKVEDEPSDSDDAETHGSLVQDVAQERSADEVDVKNESGSERVGVPSVPSPPQPRVTRSKGARQAETQRRPETSPRRTRSGTRARAAPPARVFPSPGTKARAVVDRVQEEEREMPYKPPQGSRAARAVRKRGRV